MSKTTRYIKADERVAAALAELLPDDVRDHMRAEKAPAKDVISQFELDHSVVYHTWANDVGDAPEDVNKWWNLTWMLKEDHRAKTKIDAKIIAKARRRDKAEKQRDALANMERLRNDLLQNTARTKPVGNKWKRSVNGKIIDRETGLEVGRKPRG